MFSLGCHLQQFYHFEYECRVEQHLPSFLIFVIYFEMQSWYHLRGVLMYFAEEVRYFRMNRDALQELLTQNDLLPDHARSHVVVALAESTWFSAQFPLV